MRLIALSLLSSLVFAVEESCFVASEWFGKRTYGQEKSDTSVLVNQMYDKATVRGIYSGGKTEIESL